MANLISQLRSASFINQFASRELFADFQDEIEAALRLGYATKVFQRSLDVTYDNILPLISEKSVLRLLPRGDVMLAISQSRRYTTATRYNLHVRVLASSIDVPPNHEDVIGGFATIIKGTACSQSGRLQHKYKAFICINHMLNKMDLHLYFTSAKECGRTVPAFPNAHTVNGIINDFVDNMCCDSIIAAARVVMSGKGYANKGCPEPGDLVRTLRCAPKHRSTSLMEYLASAQIEHMNFLFCGNVVSGTVISDPNQKAPRKKGCACDQPECGLERIVEDGCICYHL